MDTKTLLIKRRATRGRPRKDESKVKVKKISVFVARDPQGIKLFTSAPTLSIYGVWEGALVNGVKPMDPRTFILKFRNAVLPERGKKLRVHMGI